MEEIQESKEREKNKDFNKTIENKIQIKKSSHFNSRTSPLSQNLKTAGNHLSAKKQEKVLVEMVYYMVNSLSTIYYTIYIYYCRYCFLLLTVSIQALSQKWSIFLTVWIYLYLMYFLLFVKSCTDHLVSKKKLVMLYCVSINFDSVVSSTFLDFNSAALIFSCGSNSRNTSLCLSVGLSQIW